MRLADLQLTNDGRVVLARLTGELDLSNTANIGGALTESVPNTALALILDLSDVQYLDSAGIHLIYELREKLRARGQTLHLVIPSDSPANDALRLAGISGHIATAQTVEAALAELG
jgi:anti-sigma B factor antagonist